MADNLTITQGSGTTIATDQVGTTHYQKIKIIDGTADSETPIPGGADGLKVDLTNNAGENIGSVVVLSGGGGTQYNEDTAHDTGAIGNIALVVRQDTAAQLATTDGDYSILINDANGRLHTLDANSAAIKTSVETIDNAISGNEMQCDIVGSLPAGTNAIGKLAANSGVDIGDVDVTTLPAITIAATQTLATVTTVGTVTTITNVVHVDDNTSTISIDDGASAITVDWNGAAPPIGAGLEATALRVTLATDSTGVISVDDNGGALTVDGTVAVTNAGITSIDSKITACNTGAVVLTSGTVTAVTAITNALPAGNNNIGDVDVASIAAGNNNIGDVDVASMPSDTFAADAQAYGKGVLCQGDDGTDRHAILVDTSGHLQVDVLSGGGGGVLTKSTASITDWTAVAQNTVNESATYDVSGCYESHLCIQAFLDTITAHTGTEFIIQTSSNTSGDEDWQDFTKFTGLVGTAVKDNIEDNPLATNSTSITLTAHTYTVKGKWLAIEDTTLINSELIYETAQSTNAITVLDGTTNEHSNTADIYNVAEVYTILIPISAYRIRVLVNNTYDSDGSTLNYKVRISKVTAI